MESEFESDGRGKSDGDGNNDKKVAREETALLKPQATLKGQNKTVKFAFKVAYFILCIVPFILQAVARKFTAKQKSLTNKIVLITGTGRGLGQGLAHEFAKRGCKIACVDMNEKGNEETAAELNASFGGKCAKAYTANVAKYEDILRLRENVENDFGPVDILVNNAGLIVGGVTVVDTPESNIQPVLSVNLGSHFWMTKAFLPKMLERNTGHIVAISSMSGLAAIPKAALYASTKWGILGMMESLTDELASIPGNEIKTTCVCPYFINTSETYTSKWSLGVPPLTVTETVDAIVSSVCKNERLVTIPGSYYWINMMLKIFPDNLVNLFKTNIIGMKIHSTTEREMKQHPNYKIMTKTAN